MNDDFVEKLTEIAGPCAVSMGDDLAGRDPGFHDDNLAAGIAVSPSTALQVASIVRLCRQRGVSIVPHGGLTGLAGGAASAPGQLVVRTDRLEGEIVIDAAGRTASVPAGATLQAIETAARQHGLSAGIDIAARGTATAGGMIATNAGGSEAFRYGVMRHRVLGLEAVTGLGETISDLKMVGKANEGIDVKQLLIGSEGILGIITQAVLRLERVVEPAFTLMVSLDRASQALDLFNRIAECPRCTLLKGEIMWQRYAVTTAQTLGSTAALPNPDARVQVIFEVAANDKDPDTLLEALAGILEARGCQDVAVANSERERAAMWQIREDSWALEKHYPRGLWYDVSVPLRMLDDYVARLETGLSSLDPEISVFVMGHLGDGNLHLTVSRIPPLDDAYETVSAIVYHGLMEAGGSISAEHGIGLEKKLALAARGDPGKLSAMRIVKQAFDPDGVMNPGKVID